MNKEQVKKLETILGKLEALENQVNDNRIRERLSSAKRELMRALPAMVEG